MLAEDVLDAYPLDRHRCLLDVGGGNGAFALAAAERAPELHLILFDVPAVAARASARFATAGLAGRAVAIGGDFRHDAWPAGEDIISFVRVLHDHEDDVAESLLRAAHTALPEGGTVLIAEPMAGTRGAEPVGDAYFGFYLLAMGQGRARTRVELTALLHAAGFTRVRPLRTRRPMLTGAMIARRAAIRS
jgi:demethylspheroidene O-methyltransferase